MTDKRDIAATILRGAFAKWFARGSLADNPYPEMPGYYSLHRAWEYGFRNSEAVLAEHNAEIAEPASQP
jgi:hypothetical protein